MKKTLIALAALATMGVASAQSSATISGTIAAGWLKALDGSKGAYLDTNSIKVGVVEDLGGGLKISASTQISGNSNRGGVVTKEDSLLSIEGNFGTLAFENTRTASWGKNYGLVGDNWLWDGAYTSVGSEVYNRVETDQLTFTSPAFNGLNVVAGFNEWDKDGASTPATKVGSLGVSYTNGKLSAGARFLSGRNSTWTSAVNKQAFEAGVNYDFGMAKVGLGYDSKRMGFSKNEKAAIGAGVAVPFGAVTVGLNYAKRDKSSFVELGLNYALSKRSSVYLDYGRSKFADGLICNQGNVVLVHNF
jgi:predicted porin